MSSRISRGFVAWFALLSHVMGDEIRLGDHTFTFPDGFEIERVAGPPLVDRPIVADFDEQGRLYCADSSGSNEKVQKQLQTRPHRILRLEDVDGDGRFDRRTVFADKMMFPEGTLWYDGSLYVSAPPSIWRLTDSDGDGVCDRRQEWFQGKTLTGCANDLHGPYLGLDGRIYWAKGAFAEQTYPRPGARPLVTRAAHIFRSRPDGSDIEPVMTGGMDNPVDVVVLPGGERIFTTTFLQHPGGGKRDGLIHAVYGGVYGKRHGVLDGHPRTGDLMPILSHLGPAAPCGLTRYRSAVFGEEYRDNLFATLFNLRKVTRHVLTPDGATYRSRDEDFLVSDNPDFHPTDVIDDADGSLLVIDTGGWYKLCCPSSQLYKPDILGAIYRVRRIDAESPDDPRGLALDWERPGPGQLVARLADDARPAVRSLARTTLAKRAARSGADIVAALAAALRDPRPLLRRNAVWAATAIATESARHIARTALADADETVRQAAAHAAGLWRDGEALDGLVRLLESGPDPVRRAAAEALGRLGDSKAVPALLAACRRPGDRVLEHSLTFALIEIGDATRTSAGVKAESPSVRRAALVALDQMEGTNLRAAQVAPLLVSDVAVLKEAAEWIVGHHPEWAADLAGSFRARLSAPTLEAGERDDLAELLARFASHPSIQALLSELLDGDGVSDGARVTALRAVGRSRLEEAPGDWMAALARLLERDDSGLRGEVLAAAHGVKAIRPPLATALLSLGQDSRRPADVRIDALSALASPLKAPDDGLLEFLFECVEPSRPVKLQTESARILAAAELDREQRRALVGVVKKAGPLVVGHLLAGFEKLQDEALGLELVDALGESPGSAALPTDTLGRWLKEAPPRVRRRGEELLSRLETDLAEKRASLDELAAKLEGGDVRRGQEVFNDSKAACVSCHAIGYLGGKIGPDLTRIGGIRTERDLLESIVFPSASFVRSYEPYVVVSKRGDVWTGVLREDSHDEVVLVSGPEADARVRVAREDILEMRPGKVSIMPAGLTEQLTTRQIADLVAFLKATK